MSDKTWTEQEVLDTLRAANESGARIKALAEKMEREAAERATPATETASPLLTTLRVKDCAECHGDPEYGIWKGVICDICQGVTKKDKAEAPACRSPVADLLKSWEAFDAHNAAPITTVCRAGLRAALTAQAALWRKDADELRRESDRMGDGPSVGSEMLLRCADELTGESG